MAITRAQQARQMYNKGSKKPAMQGGGPNYLGKQREVKVPVKWKSSPDHPDTELAYITEPEKQVLIALNMHGGLEDGKPNKGPKGVISLQGDMGSVGGAGQGDPGDTSNIERGIMGFGLGPNATTGNIGDFEDRGPDRSAGGFNSPPGFAGPSGFGPPSRGDERGEIPIWMKLGYSSEEEYNAAIGRGLPAAVQPQQTMDLNRIAYRLMADGGFLEDTDEARQAYGLGSIVKKAFKTVRKPFKAVTKTLKKVAKSPTGRLLLAVAAPYALGPAMAPYMASLSAAQQAALISGATTGITQLA